MKVEGCPPSPWPRLAFGLALGAVGVIELAENLGLVDGGEIYPYLLPIAALALAAAFLIGRRGHPSRSWGWVFLVFGALLTARAAGADIAIEPLTLFWPTMLILVGFALVRRALAASPASADAAAEKVSSFAILSGVERTARSSAFRGGELTAVMGGVGLDLRGATLSPEGAVLDVFAMWGGIEITVPEGWQVDLRVVPLLGGFEDRTRPVGTGASGSRLVIRGTVVMAGGEVHN